MGGDALSETRKGGEERWRHGNEESCSTVSVSGLSRLRHLEPSSSLGLLTDRFYCIPLLLESHPISYHPFSCHLMSSQPIPTDPIPSHPIPSHPIPSHPIQSPAPCSPCWTAPHLPLAVASCGSGSPARFCACQPSWRDRGPLQTSR